MHRDASGGPPGTFRELSVSWPHERVTEFYRNQLTAHGWVTSVKTTPTSGVLAFSKTVAEQEVELLIYTSPDSNDVILVARTPC